MNKKVIPFILVIVMLALGSCKADDPSVGVSIKPQEDDILVASDTFHIKSAENYLPRISAQTDTMLLGEFYSKTFGTTKAELFVQLAPPVDYKFPDENYNPTPDSLVMMMGYNTWFGASNTPLEISIYEMNRQTLDYNTRYYNDINPGDYTDSTILMGKRLVTSVDMTISDSVRNEDGYFPTIKYKFDDVQLKRMFDMPHDAYQSTEAFCNNFKGMYITTRYGASTIFHIKSLEMKLYYHYTIQLNGKDTVINTYILYPANKEVRQVNRITHPDIRTVVKENDSVCHIKSAGGIYPKLTLPIGAIREAINKKIGEKELNINAATIVIEAAEVEQYQLDLPAPSYLLAVTEDKYEEFLSDYDLPAQADSNMVLATLETSMSYHIDLAYLMSKHIKKDRYNYDSDDDLTIYLIPVDVQLGSSDNTVKRIRPRTKTSGIVIRSDKNEYSPLKLQLLYSGF